MENVMVDTNVLFSGLFFKGKPHRVLEIIRKKHLLILSQDIVEEMHELINTEFPNKRFVFDSFVFLTKHKFIHKIKQKYFKEAKDLIRDEKDIPILAAVLMTKPDWFVTGDPDFHTSRIKERINVVTPHEFLKKIRKDS